MPSKRSDIFISAVTSEFGKARDALAADLRARGHEVAVESDFRQEPDSGTMLGALADYIRHCDIVICLVGKRSGGTPPPDDAEGFAKALPAGITEASYTQWEYFLALDFKRRAYVYVARDDYVADEAAPNDRTALQDAFRNRLTAKNVSYGPFSNIDQLARAVLKDLPEITGKPEGRPQSGAKPIVLPYQSIGDLFKGRDDFMRRLHDSLTRARGARTAIVSQALYGLGGIGKTRAAVEYAWTNADEYSALLFVVAEAPEALRRNLAALVDVLLPQLDTTDDAARLAAVLDWLKANPGWFLILDNVDTKEALAEVEYLLRDLVGGHLVVTSRLAEFSGHFQPLELDVLAIEDAVAFLLERTKDRRRVTAEDGAKAGEVAQELGRLALALEQAAAFVAKRRTFAEYLEQWRSSRGEVLEWFDKTITDYPRSVAVTWQTSVAQLSEGGRRLLERLAWLAPEKVPESLIDVPVPGAEGENLREAFDDLAAYSLVTRDAEGPFFFVHRLVQDVTRRRLADQTQPRGLVEALGWINRAFPFDSDDVRSWQKAELLSPHARTVMGYADAAGIPDPTGRLMSQVGILLRGKALHDEAEPLFQRTLAIAESNLGPDHTTVAIRLNNLAQLLQDTNRLDEAEPLMRRALAIDEKSLGLDHPAIASDLNNLAQLLHATNRLAEAEPLMRRALAIDEKSLGPDHRDVAIDLNNLAGLLQATKRFTEAEPLMRRALAIDEKSFGPDHPSVASDLSNLGQLLKDTKRFAEAEPLMRRSIAVFVEFTRRTGHRHPHLDQAVSNYVRLLTAMGKRQAEIKAACTGLMRSVSDGPSPRGDRRGPRNLKG